MAGQAESTEKLSFSFAGILARHGVPLRRGGPRAANENHQSAIADGSHLRSHLFVLEVRF